MLNGAIIFVGGGLGSLARWWCSGLMARYFGETFPCGTLFVNVTGSFAIGFFATVSGTEGRWLVGPSGRNFFMTGVCGGYTTFSSFSLQTLNLAQEREWLYAGANVALNFFLCLAGVWLGHLAAAVLNPAKGR